MTDPTTCSSDMPTTFDPVQLELSVAESCETCRYWHRFNGETAGECRRYPPFDGGFPGTSARTWCGEWKGAEVTT